MLVSMPLQSAPALPDLTGFSARPDATTQQAYQSASAEKSGSGQSNPSPLDTVALSSTARDMSSLAREKSASNIARGAATEKQQTDTAEKQVKAYLAAGKNFPPFLGNSNELKSIKQVSLSLYREILLMIIPPPLNVSPADLEMITSTSSATTPESKTSSAA